MKQKLVITISHQFGCGGSEIGRKLSEALSIPFVDRQILSMIADRLNIPEDDLDDRDERLTSFWEGFLRREAFNDPLYAAVADRDYPSDKALLTLERRFIVEIAQKGPVIFLGRGANYLLQDFDPHLSVYVCAQFDDRIKRTSERRNLTGDKAREFIVKNDAERNRYMRSFTRMEWTDARNYDLCVNTSVVGIEKTVDLIKECLPSL